MEIDKQEYKRVYEGYFKNKNEYMRILEEDKSGCKEK